MITWLVTYYYSVQAAIWAYLMGWRERGLLGAVMKKRYLANNCWAVVSGGSDGVGLGFVRALASLGWNVMVLGRNEEKLQGVIEELASAHPHQQFEFFTCEAGLAGEELSSRLRDLVGVLSERSVGMLVNNVGRTEGVFGWFGDQDSDWSDEQSEAEDATQTIRINCVFAAKITRLLLPALLRHTNSGTRTRSAIVNISSILAWTPCPFNPIYGATKAFNRAFSRALSAEYAQLGVDVLCVSPGLVQSQLTGLGKGSLLASDPQSTAEYALSALGMAIEVFPHPLHGITAVGAVVIGWLPMKIASLLTALLLRFLPKPPGIKVSRDFRVR